MCAIQALTQTYGKARKALRSLRIAPIACGTLALFEIVVLRRAIVRVTVTFSIPGKNQDWPLSVFALML